MGLAAAGVALFFMHMAAEFIVQLLFAWVIVLSAGPLFYWLQKKRVPGWLSLVLTLLAIIAVFGSLLVVVIVASNRLAELLTTYTVQIEDFKVSVTEILEGLGVGHANANDSAQLIDPMRILNFYAGIIAGLAAVFGDIIFIFMIIILALSRPSICRRRSPLSWRQATSTFSAWLISPPIYGPMFPLLRGSVCW
ncbi:MAG: AI-2E family transporter [Candidatus Promineifilaceae bacterium]